ncbi:C45 family autoproteolytic acyltransferase/hydrolase [Aquibacillus koreensis]|uniref:C45 family autoproteolytic acyltransferase/hydrolase n=1 Tax=Aquibacillus koreensis TaxID=279446 RepID=A0A9X4AKY8_9BACI|nr:C45 family peptidase [Aquibacillus koreensis]MCT2536939.1 C45 family autoproteolytic acyltransferase/hydrolase [Aquibacillus koreensis]MDC3421930.1 C45 family autoproteolytic acyltransferase/hydrolase [Aquibacillus koreensis]
MQAVFSDVVQFTGNHYDFGYMQGELLKGSPILPNRFKQWTSKRTRYFSINQQESITILQRFIPGMIDEIRGLADALNWNMEDALREFGGHYVDYSRSGCSILTGTNYMVRNYDSHPSGYEGRFVLYKPTDTGYAVVGPSMQITGRMDGMNEKGLMMGYNFVNRIGSGDGFICNMIGRIILETCATVEEAISVLREIPHRTTFNYVLLDRNGKTIVVEASPRSVTERTTNVCTNHFELLTDENRYRMDDSIRRQNLMKNNQIDNSNVVQAFELLNNSEKEVFSKKYDAWSGTLHTTVYDTELNKVWFSIGANQKPVVIDVDEFLQGEKIRIKRIKGKLDFDKPFLNDHHM